MRTMRIGIWQLWIVAGMVTSASFAAHIDGDATKGAEIGRQCLACHSLQPSQHLTGPSLAGIFGRQAGAAEGFGRYSDALRKSEIIWDADTLDAWLRNPAELVPDNSMLFQGIAETDSRHDLIAYLESATASSAASGSGQQTMRPRLANLKEPTSTQRVMALRYCGDAYYVTLATGSTHTFWEFNLRFKSDSSKYGPQHGEPAIVRAGMRGDRASIVFADPAEISAFIKKDCEDG